MEKWLFQVSNSHDIVLCIHVLCTQTSAKNRLFDRFLMYFRELDGVWKQMR